MAAVWSPQRSAQYFELQTNFKNNQALFQLVHYWANAFFSGGNPAQPLARSVTSATQ